MYTAIDIAASYLVGYPMLVAWLSIISTAVFYWRWGGGRGGMSSSAAVPGPQDEPAPAVSVIVACRNHAQQVAATLEALSAQTYAAFEVIAVNDASTDDTGAALDTLRHRFSFLRVVHLATAQGAARTWCTGALLSRHDYLVCIDGDQRLDPQALSHLMARLLDSERVGAVISAARPDERGGLGQRLMAALLNDARLSARAQRVWSPLLCVPTGAVAYRKAALHQVGYWGLDGGGEDRTLTWRLQAAQWQVCFEPRAVCRTAAATTFAALWRERLRAAAERSEALWRYAPSAWRWRWRRWWPLYLDQALRALWALLVVAFPALWFALRGEHDSGGLSAGFVAPAWIAAAAMVTWLAQWGLAALLAPRYETAARNFGPALTACCIPVGWLLRGAVLIAAAPGLWAARGVAKFRSTSAERGSLRQPLQTVVTLAAIAGFFHVDATHLNTWRQAGRLRVAHDGRGLIERVQAEQDLQRVVDQRLPAAIAPALPPPVAPAVPAPRSFAKQPGAFEYGGRLYFT